MSPSLKPKILVVDDENINLTKIKNILQDLDVELVMVTSGEKGVTAALNTDFAFVLLDVEMPKMNGFDTAALLRENESNKSLPIIFLTTLDADEIKIFKGYNEGAVSYLFKPLNRELLLRKVGSFIDIYEKTIELQRCNAALQEFAQIAAKDLTSPVRHINTLIKIVRECYQEGNPEEFNKYVDLIINSPQRMDGLVGGLLSYAKVEEQQPNFERINLNALIKDLVNEFSPEVSEYEVRIEVGKLPTIDCSPFHIHKAVYNIISNAIKYRKKDTQPVIRISAYNNDTDKTASIIIEDNGIGFDSIHAENFFKPFARAIGTGEVEGSGIGLATVRKFLEMHDGTIKAEGTKGIGATFTLTIPITLGEWR